MKQLLVSDYGSVVRFPALSLTYLLQNAQPTVGLYRGVSLGVRPPDCRTEHSPMCSVEQLIRDSTLLTTFKVWHPYSDTDWIWQHGTESFLKS